MVQSWVVVKKICDEGQVQFVHAGGDIDGGNETAAVELCRLLQHEFCPLQQIRFLKPKHSRRRTVRERQDRVRTHHQRLHGDAGVLRRDLVEQMGVNLGISYVSLEIVAPPVNAGPLQVIVHPSEEYGLGRESHQVLELLTIGKKGRQARAVLEGYLIEQSDLKIGVNH